MLQATIRIIITKIRANSITWDQTYNKVIKMVYVSYFHSLYVVIFSKTIINIVVAVERVPFKRG